MEHTSRRRRVDPLRWVQVVIAVAFLAAILVERQLLGWTALAIVVTGIIGMIFVQVVNTILVRREKNVEL